MRFALIIATLSIFLLRCIYAVNMSCLVMRPGYGLVSEECPSHAVGCRIRAKKDYIDWYELSRLYDRNQLVCVYPEEYETLTGCVKKPTGSVRCWCGGRPDCNDPEISRDLYEAFMSGDTDSVKTIGEWLVNDKSQDHWRTTKAAETTTTTTTTSSTTPATTTTPERTTRNELKKTTTTTDSLQSNAINMPTEFGDNSFEVTRRQLQKEMEKEEEQLKSMLADEEDEKLDELNLIRPLSTDDSDEDNMIQEFNKDEYRFMDSDIHYEGSVKKQRANRHSLDDSQFVADQPDYFDGNSVKSLFSISATLLFLFIHFTFLFV